MSDHYVNNSTVSSPSVPGKRELTEAALLFAAFFLPGYLSQPINFDPSLFTSLSFHGTYLLHTLPRIGIILYILVRTRGGSLARYGLRRLSSRSLPETLLAFLGAMGISMLMSLVALQAGLPGPFEAPGDAAPAAAPDLPSPFMLPLLLVTCLTIGYFEELFFRAYLLGEFARSTAARLPAAVAASLLFAAGHGYQGIVGFAGTFLIGLFFAYRFFRRSSLHEIAIGHGLYNFAAVLLLLAR
jgi:hypothetical protein